MDQPWIVEARKHIGTREIPGAKHDPKIIQWFKAIKSPWFNTDEIPWCAAFVGGCLEAVSIKSTHSATAKSYLMWGSTLASPAFGCIVVFSRTGGGHVGFVVGIDETDRLMVLGGNQGDAVTIAPFSRDRVVGYRWPALVPLDTCKPPLLASSAQNSINEE